MTCSLIAELDEILGFQDWQCLHREAGELMVTWIERFDPWLGGDSDRWERFCCPAYSIPTINNDAIRQLFADIETGRRSVTVVNKDTLKEVEVKADFWTIYRWEIHRGPPETLREYGAEWVASKLRLTSKAKRGRPSQSIDPAEAHRLMQKAREEAGRRGLKRAHEVEILGAAGASRRAARAILGPKKSKQK